MSVFEERLIEVICAVIAGVVCIGGFFGVIFTLEFLDKTFPHFGISLAVIVLIGITLYGIYLAVKFIHWLFIEPFRKGRAE